MDTVIDNIGCIFSELTIGEEFTLDPAKWFLDQPSVGKDAWLLGYAYDGVVWGKVNGTQLVIANDIFGNRFPQLTVETLTSARLFGESAEIRVSRRSDRFSAVRIDDVSGVNHSSFMRSYYLYGNEVIEGKEDWSWFKDGQLGIYQAIPLQQDNNKKGRYSQLCVRYYIDYEKNHGQATVSANRLVELKEM